MIRTISALAFFFLMVEISMTFGAPTKAIADKAVPFPMATIPYVGDAPPKIDGHINEDEYENFSALTGMITMGDFSGTMVTAVPAMQQVVWYLGYDDAYLYIAMRSPNPPGSWPLALTKANDDGNKILWDDHVEIQIAKERSKATFYGKGFYKIMANAKGFKNDDWYYNSTPGTEAAWDITGPIKSGVTSEFWDLEMAIDLRALGETKLDDKHWVLQLLRADAPSGIYFAGWVGKSWMSWKEFGEVTFARHAPVFRFLKTGELVTGKMDLGFEVTGRSPTQVPVKVEVSVYDGKGKTLYSEARTVNAVKGKVEAIVFKSDLPISDRDNTVTIHASCPTGEEAGAERRVLYRATLPVHKLTETYRKTHIEPWLANKPAGDFGWDFAYWPSYGVAKSALDVDFFGISQEKAEASAFLVEVMNQSGKILASAKTGIQNKSGAMVVKGLDLPEGKYQAKVTVFGADGKTVVGTRTMDFVRKKYEWENTTLGLADKVTAPYTPIQSDIEKRQFSVTLRDYEFSEAGLLAQVTAAGGRGPAPLLRAPMALSAVQQGRKSELRVDHHKVSKTSGARVEMSAEGSLAGTGCRVDTWMEYDGYTRVKLTLEKGRKPGAVFDALRLVVPLWNGVDTMYMQRANDSRNGGKYGDLPAGEGRVWGSDELLPYQDWQSFCPIVFLGNGDKGFWWFAEENRDWTMSEKAPAVEVIRSKAGVDLVFNLFADTTSLDRTREIEFAFLIDPVRQVENERQWAWGRKSYSHNTFGYRYWGDSVDGFEMSDDGLKGLKALFTDPEWSMSKEHQKHKRGHYAKYMRDKYYGRVGSEGETMTLYGSGQMTGLGDEAFKTFGGEWLGKTNWKPSPQTEFTKAFNSQGTKRWETPEELSSQPINWSPSFVDFFLHHHNRLLSNVPVNGTWWDNVSIATYEDYDPERGEFYQKFNVFTRRELTKRLNHIGWEVGRRPWWISNLHVDWSFCQVAWHIENDFYTSNEDTVMTDQLTFGEFRALCRIKRGIIHRLATRGPQGSNEQVRRVGRNAVGMCLLHDIGAYQWGAIQGFDQPILDILDKEVGFFDYATFIPYWKNQALSINTPGVQVSLYRGKGKVVAVLVSSLRGDADLEIELNAKAILNGNKVTRVRDAETGRELRLLPNRKAGTIQLYEFKKYSIGIPDRGLRLLVIE
jgi:hypothetical protein